MDNIIWVLNGCIDHIHQFGEWVLWVYHGQSPPCPGVSQKPVSLAEGRLSDSVIFPAIDVALPPVILPIELMLSMFMVIFSWFAANANGEAIPTMRETAATMPTIAIKFNLYMHLQIDFTGI